MSTSMMANSAVYTVENEVWMDPQLFSELFEDYEGLEEIMWIPHSERPMAPTRGLLLPGVEAMSRYSEKPAAAATTGNTHPDTTGKSARQLKLEEEKRQKLERREAVLREQGRNMRALAKSTSAVGAVPQKRKRSRDDDDEETATKRVLTDEVAAGIAQQRKHSFSDDLNNETGRRDSVTGAGEEEAAAKVGGKLEKGAGAPEQHLAPPAKASIAPMTRETQEMNDDDDGEMERMLKAELAKQCAEYEAEQEDPRVGEILQPLTEHEKLRLAVFFEQREKKGYPLPTVEDLQKAVEAVFKTRAETEMKEKKRLLQGAPKRPSPLGTGGDGMAGEAEEQEIDPRPKLAPKSRKVAPLATHKTIAAVHTTSTASDDLEIDENPPSLHPPRMTAPNPTPLARYTGGHSDLSSTTTTHAPSNLDATSKAKATTYLSITSAASTEQPLDRS